MPKEQLENRILSEEETYPRERLEKLQGERLRATVAKVADVPFYKEKFQAAGITPDSIHSIADIEKLPFTTKADLRDYYPLGFLAVPRSEVARFHGSSGTTGKPTFVAYTKNDMKVWSHLCARFLYAGGVRKEHTAQIAFGYGLFTGGFGLHYGMEELGTAVIPVSSGNTKRQLMIMQDMQPEVLICTPSYALTIAEVLKSEGIDPKSLALKYAHLGGEPWTEQMRDEIEAAFDICAFNNYGLSEVIGPGVSGECVHRAGMHIQEDHFLFECLDPETLEPVPRGEPGELVITSLSKEAMPIIRYRTRDIATIYPEECKCGRTSLRMSRVIGRSDDMMILRGVNVFPSQIEEALLAVEGTAPHYQIVITRPNTLDEITVRVELRPEMVSDKLADMTILKQRILNSIVSITGISVKLELLSTGTLERFEGKAKRVVDQREKLKM